MFPTDPSPILLLVQPGPSHEAAGARGHQGLVLPLPQRSPHLPPPLLRTADGEVPPLFPLQPPLAPLGSALVPPHPPLLLLPLPLAPARHPLDVPAVRALPLHPHVLIDRLRGLLQSRHGGGSWTPPLLLLLYGRCHGGLPSGLGCGQEGCGKRRLLRGPSHRGNGGCGVAPASVGPDAGEGGAAPRGKAQGRGREGGARPQPHRRCSSHPSGETASGAGACRGGGGAGELGDAVLDPAALLLPDLDDAGAAALRGVQLLFHVVEEGGAVYPVFLGSGLLAPGQEERLLAELGPAGGAGGQLQLGDWPPGLGQGEVSEGGRLETQSGCDNISDNDPFVLIKPTSGIFTVTNS